MKFIILDVDYDAPKELDTQIPFKITLIKQMPGEDRSDYWLAKTNKSIKWQEENCEINYVVVSSRYVGTTIDSKIKKIILGLAYVIDESLLDDSTLNMGKCKYVAICEANRTLF